MPFRETSAVRIRGTHVRGAFVFSQGTGPYGAEVVYK